MPITRREWVLASLCWSELLAQSTTRNSPKLSVLSRAEASEIRALAAIILPETDTPGAEQAGVIYFIDAALAGYDHPQLELYRTGLSEMRALSRRMFPSSPNLAELPIPARTTLLRAVEKSEFFQKLRTHTVLGYFGNPKFGWKLVGRDPAMHFEPPFGFYDAEVNVK
jgi:gluconate 2-dehydrogenase gamma chain